MKQINAGAYEALQKLKIEGEFIYLPIENIGRENYLKLKEIFGRLGGKYKNGGKFHFTNQDPRQILKALLESKIIPDKNPLEFFPTQKAVRDIMLERAGLDGDECKTDSLWRIPYGVKHRLLEPNGGSGAIVEDVRNQCPDIDMDIVELSPINASLLRQKGFDVYEGDFLTFDPKGGSYHTILMNPPFNVGNNPLHYTEHIYKAYQHLYVQNDDYYGVLVSVVPTNFLTLQTEKAKAFRKFVREHGSFEMLPKDAFVESGTKVQTALITLTTEPKAFEQKPHNGADTYAEWYLAVILDNNYYYESANNGVRIAAITKTIEDYSYDKVDCTDISKTTFDKHYKFYRAIVDELLDKWTALNEGTISPTEKDINNVVKRCFMKTYYHYHSEERPDNWQDDYDEDDQPIWDCNDAPTHRAFKAAIEAYFEEK